MAATVDPAHRPPVLVLGAGYRAGPWVVRSLRRAGFPVVPVVFGDRLEGRTPAAPRPVRMPSPAADLAGMVARVEEICRREGVGVVFPVTEDATRAVALGAPDLGGAVVAGPDRAQYEALCDKARLGETAAAAGVAHPVSVTVAPGDPAPDLPPPVVVKPADSGEAGDRDLGVVAAHDAATRDAALARFAAAGARAVVQEMLTGPAWLVHGVRARDASRTACIRVRATWPRDAGVSSVNILDRAAAPLAAGVTPLLDAVGYVGPWCMNAFEAGGRLVVHDVNLRPAASVALGMRAGLDVPALGALAALGLPLPDEPPLRELLYVNTDGEARALVAALRGRGPAGRREAVTDLSRMLSTPGRVLDPSPLDPVWLAGLAAGSLVRSARRVRRRSRGRGRAASTP